MQILKELPNGEREIVDDFTHLKDMREEGYKPLVAQPNLIIYSINGRANPPKAEVGTYGGRSNPKMVNGYCGN